MLSMVVPYLSRWRDVQGRGQRGGGSLVEKRGWAREVVGGGDVRVEVEVVAVWI